MSLNNIEKLRRQLYRYRTWVSLNDVQLHWKYQKFVTSVVIGDRYTHETEPEFDNRVADYWAAHRAGYCLYAYASALRTHLYDDVYYDMLLYLETAKGDYCSTSQHGYICLCLWLDEFKLSFDATLHFSWPDDNIMRKCKRACEAERKLKYPSNRA
jgi:hypothetical protein